MTNNMDPAQQDLETTITIQEQEIEHLQRQLSALRTKLDESNQLASIELAKSTALFNQLTIARNAADFHKARADAFSTYWNETIHRSDENGLTFEQLHAALDRLTVKLERIHAKRDQS